MISLVRIGLGECETGTDSSDHAGGNAHGPAEGPCLPHTIAHPHGAKRDRAVTSPQAGTAPRHLIVAPQPRMSSTAGDNDPNGGLLGYLPDPRGGIAMRRWLTIGGVIVVLGAAPAVALAVTRSSTGGGSSPVNCQTTRWTSTAVSATASFAPISALTTNIAAIFPVTVTVSGVVKG